MHRRTFLQSLCVLTAALAVGHTPAQPMGADRLIDPETDIAFRFPTDGWAYGCLSPGDVFTMPLRYVTVFQSAMFVVPDAEFLRSTIKQVILDYCPWFVEGQHHITRFERNERYGETLVMVEG